MTGGSAIHDVLVIGGGPSGAAAALALARRGADVALVEARAFPRDKPCGCVLSPRALAALRRAAPEAARRAAPVSRLALSSAGEAPSVHRPMPGPAAALGRDALDAMLLSRAARDGARVHQPMRVETVRYEKDAATAWAGSMRLRARCVIHADGSGRHDPHGAAGKAPARVALQARVEGLSPDAPLSMHGLGAGTARGYGGLVPLPDGTGVFAAAVDRALVRRHGTDTLLDALAPEGTLKRLGPWRGCGVTAASAPGPGHFRSLRIGNAAGAPEPFGGEGIGLALEEGLLLGRILDPAAPERAAHRLAAHRRRRMRGRGPACALAAWAMTAPAVARPALRAARAMPGATRATARVMGK